MSEYAFEAAKRSSASISWSFATQTLSSDVSQPFAQPIGAIFQSVIESAFARWTGVSGLTFTEVPDSGAVPIRIGFGSFTLIGELGETDFRYARGVIGNDTLIRLLDPGANPIGIDLSGNYAYQQYGVTLYQVALHEIGHALGLAHTTDPLTAMYPYATSRNTDLTTGDIQGLNMLYPYFTVAAVNPVQFEGAAGSADTYNFVVTRYGDPNVTLSVNYSITGAAYPTLTGSVAAAGPAFVGGALPSGILSFAAGSSTATLSVATAGNAIAQADQGFAIALSSSNPIDSVTVRGTVNALILDDDGYGQISGTALGVYRFFDSTDGTHFYSASQAERNTLLQTRPDLVYEGVGLNAVASPLTDPAATAVYRFFDTRNGTHFYSASDGERDTTLATRPDLTFEGTAFYEHAAAQAGDMPIYRFFDLADGTHFYSSSASERATILATRSDLRDEGIGFYAPST